MCFSSFLFFFKNTLRQRADIDDSSIFSAAEILIYNLKDPGSIPDRLGRKAASFRTTWLCFKLFTWEHEEIYGETLVADASTSVALTGLCLYLPFDHHNLSFPLPANSWMNGKDFHYICIKTLSSLHSRHLLTSISAFPVIFSKICCISQFTREAHFFFTNIQHSRPPSHVLIRLG